MVLESKERLEFLVTEVCIWPKLIVDGIIDMYLVHLLWLEFHLYLWRLRESVEYIKTQMVMDLLFIEKF